MKHISKKSPLRTLTVSDLPPKERPRERLYEKGAENLTDSELLAIILRTGYRGESVIHLAQRLLSKFGSLDKLMNASIDDLKNIKGIGTAKASELISVFQIARRIKIKDNELSEKHISKKIIDNPSLAADMIRSYIPDFMREHFLIASFDTRGRLLGTDIVSVGILTSSLVHPREVFRFAIKRHAASVIAAHNHPSGDLKPSGEDIKITKRLHEAGKLLGIDLKDHLIISKTSYYSFSEEGYI
ncbi:MAG: DNA repair protein RadC [Ignavibacteria bacterium]|nr:DNA repair protein RadC [Ignavibacteria bacterium]